MDDYVLVHHGVKGMKWGVRRYRNPDGTLTAEGKAHYGTTHPMTKGQATRAIVKSNITFKRKATAKVDSDVVKAVESDKEAKNLRKRRDRLKQEADREYDLAKYKRDDYERLQNKSNRDLIDIITTETSRNEADRQYERYRRAADRLANANDAYTKRVRDIGHQYYEQYKRAAVKDIGLDDIDAGVKMLEAYDLVDLSLGYRSRWYGDAR